MNCLIVLQAGWLLVLLSVAQQPAVGGPSGPSGPSEQFGELSPLERRFAQLERAIRDTKSQLEVYIAEEPKENSVVELALQDLLADLRELGQLGARLAKGSSVSLASLADGQRAQLEQLETEVCAKTSPLAALCPEVREAIGESVTSQR